MFIVMFLLAAVYLAFSAVLWRLTGNFLLIVIFAGSGLLIQYFFSDKLALMSMGAHEVTPEQAPELHAMVERLVQQMDLPKPRVAIADTDMPNAFATGRSPKHAVLCCTTGIMRRLNSDEMESVLAHEMTHIKHRDVAVITFASFFATVAAFIMQWGFWLGMMGGDRSDEDRNGNAFALVYLASILVWVVSFFLIRALSRYRELAADRGSAIITGAPMNLESALMKISTGMARIPNGRPALERDAERVLHRAGAGRRHVGERVALHASVARAPHRPTAAHSGRNVRHAVGEAVGNRQ